MNRGGALQSSPWWDLNTMINPSSSSFHDNQQQLIPLSWSQLLMGGGGHGGLVEEEPAYTQEHQVLLPASASSVLMVDAMENEQINTRPASASWSQMVLPSSSPRSCVTTSFGSTNILDFSNTSTNQGNFKNQKLDECNSTPTGGTKNKKSRVETSSSQSNSKVMKKEKLGDRITALHQLVSPFGKTDTASVLLEAIGYIRFLHSQIQAPYLGTGTGENNLHSAVQGERSCIFPEDSGQDGLSEAKDLKSRGLCLVPLSLVTHAVSDNAADYYWTQPF